MKWEWMLSKQTENSNNTISELNKWEIANTVSTVINALLSSIVCYSHKKPVKWRYYYYSHSAKEETEG